jgi:hypothetical protein
MSTISSPRPILKSLSSVPKRPPPLNQGDLFSATLKVEFSPGFTSPHVHFPPSPALSTIIAVDKKGYHSTVSPKVDGSQYIVHTTKLRADVPTATFDYSITSSSDSSSDSDDSNSEIKSKRPSIRFAKIPNSPIPRARSQQEIDKALSFLPHSPFPRSPKLKNVTIPRPSFLKTKKELNAQRSSTLPPPSPRGKQGRKGKPTALKVRAFDGLRFAPPGLMPHTSLSPVPESPFTPAVIVDGPSSDEATDSTTSTLRSAFWRSVSVHQSSGDESESSSDALTLLSPSLPSSSPPPASPYPIFMFGRRTDGTLWSPGLPRKSLKGLPSVFSPATIAFTEKTFESMMSPAPKDNISSFSSFAAALEYLGADEMITIST